MARAGVTPNQVTVVGAGVVIGGSVLVAGSSDLLGALVILLGSASDLLDGAVARGGGTASKAGAFLDSTLDRISDAAVFSAVAFGAVGSELWTVDAGPSVPDRVSLDPVLVVALALGALVGGSLTSYIKARAEGLGLRCDVGIIERPERILIICAGLLTGTTSVALMVLVLLSWVTVVQRFRHTWQQVRQSP